MARRRPAVIRAWFAVGVGATCLLLACVLRAAEPAATDVTLARLLFTEATALESRGRWPEAADKLREAIGIKETPGLRYHLAYAEEHMGLLVEALADYERAAALLDAGAPAPDVAKLVGPARDRVRKRTPTLLIHLPTNLEHATLTVDDHPLPGPFEQPIALNPGTHRLVVTAAGHEPLTLDVRVTEGERQTLDAKLEPHPSAGPSAASPAAAAPMTSAEAQQGTVPGGPEPRTERPEQAKSGTLRTVILASEAGIAVAALGVGIGYALRKSADEDRIAEAQQDVGTSSSFCTSNPSAPACRQLDDAIADANQARLVSNVAFLTAGVAAVGAVVTFVVWPSREGRGVRVAGGVAPQTAFVAVSSAF